ncbi:ABC transporter permease [Luteococcus sp. OSA5]|uniref:ABC transporter permease n=1 Tax=Luteococcus sp. OSA5 TaxID=3401630 RepID=UPI003B42B98C
MSTTPVVAAHQATDHQPVAKDRPSTPLGRIASLTRAELKMLLRSKVSFFYAISLAPMMVVLMAEMPATKKLMEAMPSGGAATMITAILVISGLSLAIYYNLTTATVARREALVLKRLRTGEASATEVLVALASPNLLIFALQVLLVLAITAAAFGSPQFTNPVLFVLALLLGAVFFAIVSFLTSVHTRTVEASQLTTMPGIFLFLAVSGLLIPLSVIPERLQLVFELLPVAPIADLVLMGLNGTTLDGQHLSTGQTWGTAVQPILVMVIWIVAAGWQLHRTMDWEPRR